MKRFSAGFTLVEIMVVVVIIGLLVAMALPAFARMQANANAGRFIGEVRVFKDAVATFTLEKGRYPVDSGSGQVDPELMDYIREEFFERPSPIGGVWDIEVNDSGVRLAVGVDQYTISKTELERIDRKFDDDNLSTGRLREIVANRRYYWVMEP